MHARRIRSQLVQTLHCRHGTLRCFGNTHRSISVPLCTRYSVDRSAAPVRYVGCFDSHQSWLGSIEPKDPSIDEADGTNRVCSFVKCRMSAPSGFYLIFQALTR